MVASLPGKLLAIPKTTRPIVLPIPITETRKSAAFGSIPAFCALSVKQSFVTFFTFVTFRSTSLLSHFSLFIFYY